MLRKAGLNAGLAGNVGKSFAMQVATENYEYYVIELSSFQLDGMFEFKADIAILLNITPDHLDRYDYNLQNYVDSKFQDQPEPDARMIFLCIVPMMRLPSGSWKESSPRPNNLVLP